MKKKSLIIQSLILSLSLRFFFSCNENELPTEVVNSEIQETGEDYLFLFMRLSPCTMAYYRFNSNGTIDFETDSGTFNSIFCVYANIRKK